MAVTKLYNNIISSGTLHSQSFLESRRIRVINIFLLLSTLVVIAFGIMNYILDLPILIAVDGFLGILLVSGIIFNRYYKWNITKFIVVYVLPLYFLVFPLFFGDIGTEYYNFVFLILGFYILDNHKSLIFLTIYITICFLLSKYLINTMDYDPKYFHLARVHYYPSVLASVLIIASGIAVFKLDTNKYQKQILETANELDKKVKELALKNDFNKSLIRELNHRVKNNLQLVSGLVTLQAYKSKNKDVVKTLNEARNRLDTIMILHQHLYQSEVTIQPNIAEYIEALVDYLKNAFEVEETIDIDLNIANLELPINLSVHIGLIFNELMINSIKYGKPEDKIRKIKLELIMEGQALVLRVKDNGTGFKIDMEIENNASFGLGLVKTVAQQYNGEVRLIDDNGAEVEVELNEIPFG